MIPLRYRPHFSIGTTLLLIGTLLLLALVPVWSAWSRYVANTAHLEPRIARLAGLEQVDQSIHHAAAAARENLRQLAFPAEMQSAQVGTAMQQIIRQQAASADLKITNSQTAPPRLREGHEEITVTVSAQGTVEELQKMLLGLQQESPRLVVSKLQLQPVNMRRARNAPPIQQLNIQLSIAAARLQS